MCSDDRGDHLGNRARLGDRAGWAPTRRQALQGLGACVGLAAFARIHSAAAEARLPRLIRTFTGHASRVNTVAFAPNGRTALSGGEDKTLVLWDVATGKVLRTLAEHTSSVQSVAFTNRNALSASYDKTLKLWDVRKGKVLRTFTGHSGPVYSVAFAPNGRTALSGSEDNTLKLWQVATGKELRTFTGNALPNSLAHSALSVAFLPDGRTALSGGAEGELKLWDVATGKELRTL